MVQRYSFLTRQWDTIKVSGDYSPRYLSALGIDPKGKYVYLLGGYGSQSGDQMLDPHNYYDLFRYNIREKSFKKLYTLRPIVKQFTFANSLVIDPRTNNYYGLIFPNDSSSSNLQLIKGSLTDSTFSLLGNTIPFLFHDIESFVDLYYSPISNKLITVVLNYSKSDEPIKTTTVKIYSVNFVPEPNDIVNDDKGTEGQRYIFILFISLGILAITGLYFFLKRRRSFAKVPFITSVVQDAELQNGKRDECFSKFRRKRDSFINISVWTISGI
jgi:hypothetical protein